MGCYRDAYQTVNDMAGVRVVGIVGPLAANEIHDLVFTFTRHTGIGDDDVQLDRSREIESENTQSTHTSFQPGSVFIFITTQ